VICNMCGFDSIPFDLGALFAVNRLRARQNDSTLPIRSVAAYISTTGGAPAPGPLARPPARPPGRPRPGHAYAVHVPEGISGGTLATGMLQKTDPVKLTHGVDALHPFLLGGAYP
jgi:hypothetical protein